MALLFRQLLLSCLLLGSVLEILGQLPFKRFEYKYSFKPPYLAQKDGSVPFFEHAGNAIASEENLRVTPSLRSQKGSIWSKLLTNFDWWEVEIVFRVTGRGRIGADGLAFWYTEERAVEGPVFGSKDQWKGLGVFFDSFDNDNKHNNPYIMALTNDGTKQYDHQNDGSTQQIAGCLRDFRNKPFPVRARIQYYRNILFVMFNNGMSNNENDFELCLRVENVFLPSRGYFGVSAATGGLADDHDVQKFMTWSLTADQPGITSDSGITNSEQQKFEKEFQNYQQELQKKKDDYLKEHPEAQKEKENEEDWFEEEQIRELRQIFQGQSDLRNLVQNLARKLDEIVGRQENTNSLITNFQQTAALSQGQHIPQVPGQVPVQQVASPLQRFEVDNILAASRELVASTREIKNLLSSISAKQDQAAARPVGSGGVDVSSSVNELKEGINAVKRDMTVVSQRVHSIPITQTGGQVACPSVSCVSTTMFIAVAVVQIAAFLGYSIYKNSKESQSKKFY
ncbi:unnamed protein product [Allacma fusca]|uniref:L-type lectin-like domain-containing protein n=1 Tax=Allacma fusca TaxID=39272 RepID=A0A8J2PYV1_9HEXA|nr:unnamed protein product [Allacma fusca]